MQPYNGPAKAINMSEVKKSRTPFPILKDQIIKRLESELSPKLYYHGPHHTRDDVLPAVIRLGELARVDAHQMLLLKTAALYHDIGYVEHYMDHETLGAHMAANELPKHGYTPSEVQIIVNLIMATRMPHNPNTFMEEIICDADLDSVGRDDFYITSHQLRLELQEMGIRVSLREWYIRQLKFLKSHEYITEMAKTLRNPTKLMIIAELEDILGEKH